MKKCIFVAFTAICVMLTSCSKMFETTYSVTNNTGTSGTVFIYECNDKNEKINVASSYISSGQTKEFTAVENAVKVKLYIDELNRWVQQVFYLKEGGNIEIIITGKTIVGRQEP